MGQKSAKSECTGHVSFSKCRVRETQETWSHHLCLLVFFVNTTQTRIAWEKEISIEIMFPSNQPVGKAVGAFSWLTLMSEGPDHCEWCHQGRWAWVVWESRNEEQAINSSFCLSSCHQIPAWMSLHDGLQTVRWNKPFPPNGFGLSIYHNNEKQTKTLLNFPMWPISQSGLFWEKPYFPLMFSVPGFCFGCCCICFKKKTFKICLINCQ